MSCVYHTSFGAWVLFRKNIPQWRILMQIRVSCIIYKLICTYYIKVFICQCWISTLKTCHFHIKIFRFETHSEKEKETKKEYKRAARQKLSC